MTGRQKLLYGYFNRLSVFCCFAAFLIIVGLPTMPDLPVMPLLFFVPFSVFLLLKELDMPKGLFIMLQIIFLGIFAMLIYTNFYGPGMIFMLITLGLMFVYIIRAEAHEPLTGAFALAVILNFIIGLILVLIDNPGVNSDPFLHTVFVNIGIATVSRLFCVYYAGVGYFANSRLIRVQDAKTVMSFFKRSQRMFFTLAAVLILAMTGSVFGGYFLEFDITLPERQPREFELEDIPPFDLGGLMEILVLDEETGELVVAEEFVYWTEERRQEVIELIVLIVGILIALWILKRNCSPGEGPTNWGLTPRQSSRMELYRINTALPI